MNISLSRTQAWTIATAFEPPPTHATIMYILVPHTAHISVYH